MSNGTITFNNNVGRFDLDGNFLSFIKIRNLIIFYPTVTTFQMAVLFAWTQRPNDKVSYENLRLATELSDTELRKTLWYFLF